MSTSITTMLHVKVLPKHIDNGWPFYSDGCPVHLALLEVGIKADVRETRILIDGKVRVMTPKEVKEFIRRFDCGEDVCPFEFDLDLTPIPVRRRSRGL